jgi:hypothetical protein
MLEDVHLVAEESARHVRLHVCLDVPPIDFQKGGDLNTRCSSRLTFLPHRWATASDRLT